MKPRLLSLFLIAPILSAAADKKIVRLDESTITPTEIDTTVNRLMKAGEVTGVGIAIFNNARPVYVKAYGFRSAEKKLLLTPDSVMTAASLTKSAFAYMVLQLVQEGRLNLDKPVYQYLPKPLPDYPNYADLAGDERYKKITARTLLSHTSGFPNWRRFNDDGKLHIHFEPGTRYAYSGEGIDLLQFVVETITHEPLEKLMQERVFKALGMDRTSMVWQPRFESDFANGYDEYGRSLGPERRSKADAAGSMQTTLSDYSLLIEELMRCDLLDSEPGGGIDLDEKMCSSALNPEIRIHSKHQFPTFATETTTENDLVWLSYGLGVGIYRTPYGKAFFKEGHDPQGFQHYFVALEDGTGLLIMTNSLNGEGIFKYLLETLLHNSYTPIEWEGFTPYDKLPPRPPLPVHTKVKIDPKLLELYSGKYGLPGTDITAAIIHEGDHLLIQESEGGSRETSQELEPKSDTEFFSTTSDDEFTFVTDVSGKVTGMVLHTGGKDIEVKRLP